jgi:hypothetical protein
MASLTSIYDIHNPISNLHVSISASTGLIVTFAHEGIGATNIIYSAPKFTISMLLRKVATSNPAAPTVEIIPAPAITNPRVQNPFRLELSQNSMLGPPLVACWHYRIGLLVRRTSDVSQSKPLHSPAWDEFELEGSATCNGDSVEN